MSLSKPKWDKPYSVASETWNHFLWVDLAALFDCELGIDKAKTFLDGENMILLFKTGNEEPYYYSEIIIKNMREWWLDCQYMATNHCRQYMKWVKNNETPQH